MKKEHEHQHNSYLIYYETFSVKSWEIALFSFSKKKYEEYEEKQFSSSPSLFLDIIM
jgi:hypothetical protein